MNYSVCKFLRSVFSKPNPTHPDEVNRCVNCGSRIRIFYSQMDMSECYNFSCSHCGSQHYWDGGCFGIAHRENKHRKQAK